MAWGGQQKEGRAVHQEHSYATIKDCQSHVLLKDYRQMDRAIEPHRAAEQHPDTPQPS